MKYRRQIIRTERGDQFVYERDGVEITQVRVVPKPGIIAVFWWMLKLWLKERIRRKR